MDDLEDDISILTLHDLNGSIDEADILFENSPLIPLNRSSSINGDSESSIIFQNAYDNLKVRYNDLYVKSETQAKKLKAMENQQSCGPVSEDSLCSGYAVVSTDCHNPSSHDNTGRYSSTDLAVLQGQVNDYKRRVMTTELKNKTLETKCKTLEDENRKLNTANEILQENRTTLENGAANSTSKVEYLEERVRNYQERIAKLESIKGKDVQQKIDDLQIECQTLRQTNEILSSQIGELAMTKRSGVVAECNPTGTLGNLTLSNGMSASNGVLDAFSSSLLLNSSLPTADELVKLKQMIKKLKSVIVNQHNALVKLQDNPAIQKILNDSGSSSRNSKIEPRAGNSVVSSGSTRNRSDRGETVPDSSRRLTPSRLSPPLAVPQFPTTYSNQSSTEDSRNPFKHQSRSEVIKGSPSEHRDIQRSHSLVSHNEAQSGDSSFQREAAMFLPTPNRGRNSQGDLYAASRNGMEPYGQSSGYQASARDFHHSESEKLCPVCNADFSHQTISDFQTHVFNCVDEQPATLTTTNSVPDRICPMCNEMFPKDCPQITVDNHVNAHFGEAAVGVGFEVLS